MEAMVWDGTTEALVKLEKWMDEGPQADFTAADVPIIVTTKEGDTKGRLGDFVLRTPDGELIVARQIHAFYTVDLG